jgi:hypothetical protein
VQSSDGEALEAIGAQWVEQQSSPHWESGPGFPNLDLKIEIPCTL